MRLLPILAVSLLTFPAAAQVRPLLDAPLVVGNEFQQIVKTLDLNGDGWMDAFGWWADTPYGLHPGEGLLHGWINDGAGNLAVAWTVPYVHNANDGLPSDHAAVGDLDNDGDDDFVIATDRWLRVYLSNGASAPTLSFTASDTSPVWIDCVELANVDADPEAELVLAASTLLAIYDFDLAGGALVQRTSITTGFSAAGKLVVAELTGDGELDVLLTGTRVHPIVGGQLQPWVHNFALPWSATTHDRRFDGGDVDGDGDFDLVAFGVPLSTGTAQYRIVRRTGPSTWSVEPPQNGGPARKLADIDGDGDLDGTCCGGGGNPERSRNSEISYFRVALNDGTGAFASSISIPSVGSQAIAGVVDLDHDGDVDLVGGRCVLYAQTPIVAQTSPPIGAGYQNARSVIDLDGDADPDYDLRASTVCLNQGDGPSVSTGLALPPARGGWVRDGDPFPGDWDGDGDVDLLFRLAGTNGLELVANMGSGCFAPVGRVADGAGMTNFPAGAMNSLAADVDADGDLDLVLRTRTSNPFGVVQTGLWRNAGGAFTWQETWDGRCVSDVADLNGDGVADLLAASGGVVSSTLSWAPGLGAGYFGAWATIPDTSVRSSMDQIALVDVDADGDLDIAAGHYVLARAYEYVNDGAGAFTRGATMLAELAAGASSPLTIEAADMDGDGLVDLVAAPIRYAANSAAVFPRASDNSGWRPRVQQTVYVLTAANLGWTFTLRDPDGDGDVDFLADRLLRNTRYQGEDGGTRMQDTFGIAGLGGVKPLFGARGPFRVGEQSQLRVRGLRPGASGRVVAAYLSDPVPPGFGPMQAATPHRIHAILPLTASGTAADPAGSGTWSLDYTVPGYSAGRTKVYMALVEDDGAPSGEARSNRLYVTYGP